MRGLASAAAPDHLVIEAGAAWSEALAEIRRFLPVQNPLPHFVHNNMLIAWEDRPFWDAVAGALDLYGGRWGLSLADYFRHWRSGVIPQTSIVAALKKFACQRGLTTPLPPHAWDLVANLMTEAPHAVRANALGEFGAVADVRKVAAPVLFDGDMVDWLSQLLASFLDHGVGGWKNPYAHDGFLRFVRSWARNTKIFAHSWQKPLTADLLGVGDDARQIICEQMAASGMSSMVWARVCLRLLFVVKGWAGLVNKCEADGQLLGEPAPHARIEDLLVVLLSLAKVAGVNLAELTAPFGLPWRSQAQSLTRLVDPTLGKVAQRLEQLGGLGRDLAGGEGRQLAEIISMLGESASVQVWHEAWEHAAHRRKLTNLTATPAPSAAAAPKILQVLCCMDDREESLRRHLEAAHPGVETFGVLGHFNLAMSFRAVGAVASTKQCPPPVSPQRLLVEEVLVPAKQGLAFVDRFLANALKPERQALGESILSAFFGSFIAGPLALASLVGGGVVAGKRDEQSKNPQTRISLSRRKDLTGSDCGYTHQEQVDIVASVLRGAAAVSLHAPIVLVTGHRSSSRNNPYAQAYGCGACSGNSGAPNARVFAQMANSPDVRQCLPALGIDVASTTVFVACVHDTASDEVIYYPDGGDTAPDSAAMAEAQRLMNAALSLNAAERCLDLTQYAGRSALNPLDRVGRRSRNAAEVRPEYGHARTYVAIFGGRGLTQHFSLNRRSFLVSYDSRADADGALLQDLVWGAAPVVANICFDYFFSRVDADAFGSGTKLPLNVSGLLGLISGARGDLRIGLAAQMVEIHEPLRPLIVIEAALPVVDRVIFNQPRLARLVRNDWLHLVAINPLDRKCREWIDGAWQIVDESPVIAQGVQT